MQTFQPQAESFYRRDITDGVIPPFATFLPCRVAGAAFPALLLTGCNSDRTVPIEAVWLPLGLCIILIGFLFYVLEQHGRSIKLIRKLQIESIRGTCSRIGTIDLDFEEGTASLDGWSFQGGFTGFVVHEYRISELEAMQSAEIERVARRAVSEVGR